MTDAQATGAGFLVIAFLLLVIARLIARAEDR